jgi:metal-responsive CopG/Arc/MetJ family transcriptional regulator
MQTTFDIPPEQLNELEKLSRDRHVHRDQLVREAIVTYIEGQARSLEEQTQSLEAAFGAWSGTFDGDSVDYQQRLRDEW